MTMHTTAEVRADVDRLLGEFYAGQVAAAEAVDPAYGRLWRALAGLAAAGGKRLRPGLLMLAYEMYGGEAYDSVIPVAVAQELLHLSLLVHDDITDNDLIRYGVDNVTGQYLKIYASHGMAAGDTRHYAESAALLAGDLLLSAAHSLVLQSGLPAGRALLAQRVLQEAVFAVAAGQLLDMEAGMAAMPETDAFKIARLKTASYSFVAPLTCGALLAEAPAAEIASLTAFGKTVGLAYQLADDLLGVFGDERLTGKSNLTDLQEGRHTYLMQLTYELASPEQMVVVRRCFGRHDLDERQADILRDIIIACGARSRVEAELETCRQTAGSQIDGLQVPAAARRRLHELVDKTTRRSS